jgi:hypothetical protein
MSNAGSLRSQIGQARPSDSEQPRYADQSYDLQAPAPDAADDYPNAGVHYATETGQGAQPPDPDWNTIASSNDRQNFGTQPQFPQPGVDVREPQSFEGPNQAQFQTSAWSVNPHASTSPPFASTTSTYPYPYQGYGSGTASQHSSLSSPPLSYTPDLRNQPSPSEAPYSEEVAVFKANTSGTQPIYSGQGLSHTSVPAPTAPVSSIQNQGPNLYQNLASPQNLSQHPSQDVVSTRYGDLQGTGDSSYSHAYRQGDSPQQSEVDGDYKNYGEPTISSLFSGRGVPLQPTPITMPEGSYMHPISQGMGSLNIDNSQRETSLTQYSCKQITILYIYLY